MAVWRSIKRRYSDSKEVIACSRCVARKKPLLSDEVRNPNPVDQVAGSLDGIANFIRVKDDVSSFSGLGSGPGTTTLTVGSMMSSSASCDSVTVQSSDR